MKRYCANTELAWQPRHKFVCGVAAVLDASAQLDGHGNLAQHLAHADNNLAELVRSVEHCMRVFSVALLRQSITGRTARPCSGREDKINRAC